MLTIFTTPKAFIGHAGVIQANAIQSWLLLHPELEVILIGNEEGMVEIASKFGVLHLPYVECNEHGTPLLNSVFKGAKHIAKYELMCYVNADIILLGGFIEAVKRIHKGSFLMVGQRWDVGLNDTIDFSDHEWDTKLQAHVRKSGKLHSKSGSDYFIFPRGLYSDIPSFAIGRGGWDNWLIYRARLLGMPVIDATEVITAIHPNHDYSHIPNDTPSVWKGIESTRNIELMKGEEHAFTIEHANWILGSNGMKRALTMRSLYFQLWALFVIIPHLHFLSKPMQALTKLIIAIRSRASY